MSKPTESPFDPFFEEIRRIVREEVETAFKAQNRSDETMLNAERAAAFLGFSKDWVYRNWRKVGGVKIGKRGVRFRREDLEAWTVSRRG